MDERNWRQERIDLEYTRLKKTPTFIKILNFNHTLNRFFAVQQ